MTSTTKKSQNENYNVLSKSLESQKQFSVYRSGRLWRRCGWGKRLPKLDPGERGEMYRLVEKIKVQHIGVNRDVIRRDVKNISKVNNLHQGVTAHLCNKHGASLHFNSHDSRLAECTEVQYTEERALYTFMDNWIMKNPI